MHPATPALPAGALAEPARKTKHNADEALASSVLVLKIVNHDVLLKKGERLGCKWCVKCCKRRTKKGRSGRLFRISEMAKEITKKVEKSVDKGEMA